MKLLGVFVFIIPPFYIMILTCPSNHSSRLIFYIIILQSDIPITTGLKVFVQSNSCLQLVGHSSSINYNPQVFLANLCVWYEQLLILVFCLMNPYNSITSQTRFKSSRDKLGYNENLNINHMTNRKIIVPQSFIHWHFHNIKVCFSFT